ncbi:MAG: hypothetical protein ACFFFC_19190, partial [Candidatus Thorarchaeota archaeon]
NQMSIIQVMDSTKSGKAIYIAASSIIAVSLAAIILTFQGVQIELTAEGLVFLVPVIGGLSLLFMSVRFERIAIEWFSTRRINGKEEKKHIKVQMAAALFYVAPWESSPKEAYTIEKSLALDLERMLRSPQFSEQVSEIQQVFWILFLLPFTLIDIILVYSMNWLLILVVLVLGLVSAGLIMKRNEMVLDRIVFYAYANWFLEGASADLERRKASIRMKSRHEDRLLASLELTKSAIDLATKGDWEGFDSKSRNLDDLVGIPGHDILKWSMIEDYLLFLQWCARHIQGIHASHVDVFLKNGNTQVNSAISVLRECRENSFDEEEEQVAKMMQKLSDISKDRETYLKFDIECYEKLGEDALKKLKDASLEILGLIPFIFSQVEPVGVKSETKGLDRLSWFVAHAAEKNLLDIRRSLSLITSWGTQVTTILSATGAFTRKTLLEHDVGFPIEQLISIAKTLGEWMLKYDNTDPYQVLGNLEDLKKKYGRPLVKKYALELQVDTKRASTEELNSGLEAITKFIDDFER